MGIKLIRNKTFETNSSSCHSLSLGKEYPLALTTIYPNEDGYVKLGGYDFGWGVEVYNDPITKASYILQDRFAERHWFSWSENRGSQYDLENEDLQAFLSLIKKYTGVENIRVLEGGYIDHESYGTSNELKTDEDLINFIFNLNALLIIDNDNDSERYCDYMQREVIYMPGGTSVSRKEYFRMTKNVLPS